MSSAISAEPAIQVHGLRKSFGDVEVLRDLDIDVPTGSVLALLGSNGAGKTTLIRILSTLILADGGTATVCGHDLDTAPSGVRASISLTGQFAAVDEVLSGRENLLLMAKLRHLQNPAEAADALVDRFALREVRSRKAGEYSGGMRRRLDIAMSLVGDPPIVFLDEPNKLMGGVPVSVVPSLLHMRWRRKQMP
ncbi:MAG: ABC transporter ATP-binding protein [Cumulibacter sp.]